jgi:hypothetical protein
MIQRLCLFLFSTFVFAELPPVQATDTLEQVRMSRGEVIVDQQDIGATKFVVAKILIDAPPEKVWPVLTNPFEFQGKISPRMKQVEVLTDRADLSVLRVTVNPGFFLPPFTYSVESRYEPDQRIDFRRVGGTLKDFKGYWTISPQSEGRKSEVTYGMYVDPGIPVPQWIIRAGVRDELPRTLTAMRERVQAVYTGHETLSTRTIAAAEHAVQHAEVPRPANHS